MNRNFTIVFSAATAMALVLLISTRLVSNSAQPPSPFTGSSSFSYGIAGDPGQTTCNHCHTGTTRVDPAKFTLKLSPDSAGLVGTANVVSGATQYIPDSVEWVSIELNGTNGSTPKFGFQVTALDSANNMAGSFALVNTQKTVSGTSVTTSRQYVGHRQADGTTKAWSFKWRTPHTGPVTFYYCCNMANGDGDDLTPGDSVYAATSTIAAGPGPNGIADLTDISAISAYPLPFTHSLTLHMTLDKSADLSLTLVSASGTVVKALYSGYSSAGTFERSFGLSDVAAGLYLIKVTSGGKEKVIRTIKL